DAGRYVETRRSEGAHGAGGEARLVQAAVARARPPVRRRQIDHLGESQRAAISMPQAPVGMDQDPERRGMDRLGLLGPALEREEGRAAEGEERGCAEGSRNL